MKRRRARSANELTAIAKGAEVVTARGKRGVRILFSTREEFGYFMMVTVFIFLPILFLISVMPFWEYIGKTYVFHIFYHAVAPTIDDLTFDFRGTLPRFPIKRFLVGVSTILLMLFALAFLPLLSRAGRKRLGLIWMTHARARLFGIFAVTGGMFFAVWYLFFYNSYIITLLGSRRSGVRLLQYAVMLTPVTTFVFGRLSAICIIGVWRFARSARRRLRANARSL